MNMRVMHYRGKTGVKRAGVKMEWTPAMIKEWVKCSEDPLYFVEKYVKIIHVDRGLISIDLYDYQRKLISTVLNNRYTVAEQSRQSGKTTAIACFVLWYIIFQSEKTVGIVSNKAESAREVLNRIQLAYQNLPSWLQPGCEEWNKGSFVLENNSKVFAGATTPDSLRGYAISLLICDEAAHVEKWNEFYTAIYPTISSGKDSKMVLISSVNGLNHFWEITTNARKGLNDFKVISVPWQEVPGRDEKWKNETLAAMNFDHDKFGQEFENRYLGSSGTLIAGWKLQQLTETGVGIPLVDKGGVKQYKPALKGHKYILVADVAEGKGLDYSAFQVIDVTALPYEQVCSFHDNVIAPYEFAQILQQIGKLFHDCPILVESNNIGTSVCETLFNDFEYENLIATVGNGKAGKQAILGWSKQAELGVKTTKTVKTVGCSLLKFLVEQDKLIIQDAPTIYELSTFSRKNKSWEAEEGKHDDLVMSLALFSWLTEQPLFKEYNDLNTLKHLRERSEEQLADELAPFAFVDDGRGEVEERLEIHDWMPFPNWPYSEKDPPPLG